MINIDLIAVPNQSLTFTEGDNFWELRIITLDSMMGADVHLNGTPVVLGQRIVSGAPILPYEYLGEHGNFAILTQDDDLPWWENFTVDQQLVFIEPEFLTHTEDLGLIRPNVIDKSAISPEFVDWWADIINRACRLGFNHGEL